jgi:hypothetical protein
VTVGVGFGLFVRHGARISATATCRAISFFAARVRILAATGLFLAAIHRAGFAATFLVTARLSGARIAVLGRAECQCRGRNRQASATYNRDYKSFRSSHLRSPLE